jgi:hypothetical protein
MVTIILRPVSDDSEYAALIGTWCSRHTNLYLVMRSGEQIPRR